MFKGLGRGQFAVGLAVGIFASVVFFVWLSGGFSEPPDAFECTVDQSKENCEETKNFVGFRIAPFISVTPSDTIAQWTMAILAAVATAASIYAIYLLKQTLQATRTTLEEAGKTTAAANLGAEHARTSAEASREANEIMRSQQRPWISFEIESAGRAKIYKPRPRKSDELLGHLKHTFNIKNHGSNPAVHLNIHTRLVKCSWSDYEYIFRKYLKGYIESGATKGVHIIRPSQTGIFHFDESQTIETLASDISTEFTDQNMGYFLFSIVSYFDINSETLMHTAEANAVRLESKKGKLCPWKFELLIETQDIN